jgi:hypothetical protein
MLIDRVISIDNQIHDLSMALFMKVIIAKFDRSQTNPPILTRIDRDTLG